MTTGGPVDGPSPAAPLTHVDEHGKAHMVDVTGKPMTRRVAEARCSVRASAVGHRRDHRRRSGGGGPDLGDHGRQTDLDAPSPLPSDPDRGHGRRRRPGAPDGLRVSAVAEVTERTGVEMEALTACAVAALVLVQPLLALDPQTSIEELTLWSKRGGRSGDWQRSAEGDDELGRTILGFSMKRCDQDSYLRAHSPT